jgi:hypothetical protein
MSKSAITLACACLTVLCACKQRQHISKANIEVVQRHYEKAQEKGGRDPGVSVKEVESVLGPPHRVDPPETSLRDVEVFRYYYQQGDDTYELHFFNGRLILLAKLPGKSTAEVNTQP